MAWKNEAEAREQIKAMVAEYYHDFKEKKTPYQEGDRITYAARVFDEPLLRFFFRTAKKGTKPPFTVLCPR